MGKVIRFERRKRAKRRRHTRNWIGHTLAAAVGLTAVAGVAIVLSGGSVPVTHYFSGTGGYALCGRWPHLNCVIDGDTFYQGFDAIRVADIDAPETHPPRCDYERQLGERATKRLQDLLNAGPFELKPYDARDRDRFGRKLRIAVRDGTSLGAVLVSEGLARPWTGARRPWCG